MGNYEEDFNKAVAELNDEFVELGKAEKQVILRAGLNDRTIDPVMGQMIQMRLDQNRPLTKTMEKALSKSGNVALQKAGREERILDYDGDDYDARAEGRRRYQSPLEKSYSYQDRYGQEVLLKGSDILMRCRELVNCRQMGLTVASMVENRINKGIPIEEETLYRMFEQS